MTLLVFAITVTSIQLPLLDPKSCKPTVYRLVFPEQFRLRNKEEPWTPTRAVSGCDVTYRMVVIVGVYE